MKTKCHVVYKHSRCLNPPSCLIDGIGSGSKSPCSAKVPREAINDLAWVLETSHLPVSF